MGLKKPTSDKKKEILSRWFDRVIDTYPPETSRMIKSQPDPFANPVGSTTWKGLEQLLDQVFSGLEPSKIKEAMDPIIRIRAVQGFTPSMAVGFVFYLKSIMLEVLGNGRLSGSDMRWIDSSIDEVALIAFDIYMQCRETIYQLKADEVKKSTYKAFKRAGLIVEEPGDIPDFTGPGNRSEV